MNIVLAQCGCTLLVDHDKGDRLTKCGGGGTSDLAECKGGISYSVHAEVVDKVTYTVRPLGGAA